MLSAPNYVKCRLSSCPWKTSNLPKGKSCTHRSQINWMIALLYMLLSPVSMGKWKTMFDSIQILIIHDGLGLDCSSSFSLIYPFPLNWTILATSQHLPLTMIWTYASLGSWNSQSILE